MHMASHKEHADLIDRFAKLINEHQDLKRQYDTLQTNFNLLAGKKMADFFSRLEKQFDEKNKG